MSAAAGQQRESGHHNSSQLNKDQEQEKKQQKEEESQQDGEGAEAEGVQEDKARRLASEYWEGVPGRQVGNVKLEGKAEATMRVFEGNIKQVNLEGGQGGAATQRGQ